MKFLHALLSLCIAIVVSWPAAATDWRVVPERSRLGFVATWEGEPFEAVFRRFSATLRFDPKTPAKGRFDVVIDVTSVESGSAERDAAMVDAEWLDATHHPQARFVTSAIRHIEGERFIAAGDLTLKGVTQPVILPFRWTGGGDSAHMSGETTLLRTDFKVGEGEWAESDEIGFEVRVRVELELRPTHEANR